MVGETAIRASELTKHYSIVDPTRTQAADGASVATYRTLREALSDWAKDPLRRSQRGIPRQRFYALRDVTFDVAQGSVVGIVGRNGAGKTTLLKVLCRITEPSSGFAELRGRVGSLLEVGTGFHPELTGRENVYLSGAILNMRKAEIDRKFDEIVAFAEVEQFIETPLKRYSTGMYLRLAFAVAAHLETEIMFVDEVLAVGDLRFRQRCLGKMREVGSGGRTILYVSHDLASIRQLCDRVIWLDNGRIVADGAPDEVVLRYEVASYEHLSSGGAVFERDPASVRGRAIWFSKIELLDAQGAPNAVFNGGDVMRMVLHLDGTAPADGYTIVWWVYNERGERVAFATANPQQPVYFDRNDRVVECEIGPVWLTSGIYRVHLGILVWGAVQWDRWEEAATFQIGITDPFGHGFNLNSADHGSVAIPHRWHTRVRL